MAFNTPRIADDAAKVGENLIVLAVGLSMISCWIYAILTDAKAERIAYTIADILLPPLGMVRGLLLYIG